MDPGISFADLLAYNADETEHWKRWFTEHPEALDLPCDIAGADTVRKLLLHIFTAELIFASLVLDQPRPKRETLPYGTIEELFGISAEAHAKFQRFLSSSAPEQWTTPIPVGFGDLQASKRKMLTQAMLHGVNHRGQLATFLRQQGFKTDWIHDFILSKVMQ